MIAQYRKDVAEVDSGDVVTLHGPEGQRRIVIADAEKAVVVYKGEVHTVVRLSGLELPVLRPVIRLAVPDQRVTVARIV